MRRFLGQLLGELASTGRYNIDRWAASWLVARTDVAPAIVHELLEHLGPRVGARIEVSDVPK